MKRYFNFKKKLIAPRIALLIGCLLTTGSSAQTHTSSEPARPFDAAPWPPSLGDQVPQSHQSALDDTPLFVTSIPTGDIGNYVVLQVSIVRFISGAECTWSDGQANPENSKQGTPTSFVLAKVISVARGQFNDSTLMLCSGQSSQNFSIGQTGYVFGPISRNTRGVARMGIGETYSRMVARRRSEGAICVWKYCTNFNPMAWWR
jgi:hypothetical protein